MHNNPLSEQSVREFIKENLLTSKGTINSNNIKKFILTEEYTIINTLYPNIPFSEQIYLIFNIRPKCICVKETKFINFSQGYRKYCSIKCSASDPELKQIKENTCIKLYGAKSYLSTKEKKEKSKATSLLKYGVDSPNKSEDIKKKQKETLKRNFGVETPLQNKDILSKVQKTNIDRYGATTPLKSEKNKKIILKKFLSKIYDSFFTGRLEDKVVPLFSKEDYINQNTKLIWKCSKCGNSFEENLEDGKIPRCVTCYPVGGSSIGEKEIVDFLIKHNIKVEEKNRFLICPYELDIYLPEYNIAIEYNGLYWHSELNGKDNKYHLNKLNLCSNKNIKLLQFYEDEWLQKKDICKNIILSNIGLLQKTHARKTEFKEVSIEEEKTFLNENHLQSYSPSTYCYGLYLGDELISLLSFIKTRFNKNHDWELLRYSTKMGFRVIGGLSKLLRNSNIKGSIISYSDRRLFSGSGYSSVGFIKYKETSPSYFYMKNYKNRLHRITYQKHKLPKLLESFDNNLTEWENMKLNGYDRVWDCGTDVWIKKSI